jgi:hypothetical protein
LGILGKRLAIAIPDTVLEENDSLREKTVKLGVIARACAIYGADSVEVFKDERGRGESRLIRKVLEYLETPQYLRKKLYSLDDSLRYAGLLPPLRIPSHKPKAPLEKLTVGEIREGVTDSEGRVDVGLDRPFRLKERVGANKRVTTRIVAKNPIIAEIIGKQDVQEYWGYDVRVRGIDEILADTEYGLKIATSRYGNALQSQVFQLRESLLKTNSVVLLFGSPWRGLFDIVGPELTKKVNYVLNLFVDQHVATVRTEEAVSAALSLVNTLVV